jgi:hypothetical protein
MGAAAPGSTADADGLHARLVALPPDTLLYLYGDMLPQDPHGAASVARALKDRARDGAFDDDKETAIALLVFCLCDAPSPATAFHLAKALAAFGREAQVGAPYVVDHVLTCHVVDDESFWIFDGLLYTLGFLGGPAAKAMVDAVGKDDPPRCAKKTAIYTGSLTLEVRRAHHAETLENVRAMLNTDPGPWRGKRSRLERKAPAQKAPQGHWLARR